MENVWATVWLHLGSGIGSLCDLGQLTPSVQVLVTNPQFGDND